MLRAVSNKRSATAVAEGPVAVVDVGSNSIRLVVYEQLSRAPSVIHNEKVTCGLGRRLARTGRLDPVGVACALANLPRFLALCRGLDVARLEMFATAAVREAADGPDFAAEVGKRLGIELRILTGDEEARLSALGVVAGNPGADGIMGDLGGGSLEMVALTRGEPGQATTLPLGPLQLIDVSGNDVEEAARVAKRRFEPPAWLEGAKGRTFFAVGGAWRALAKFHMAQTNYPVPVIHNYELEVEEARELATAVTRLDPEGKVPGVAKARLRMLPYAAILLKRVIAAAEPSRIVFSAFGLREGQIYDLLPEAERKADPLISACRDLAKREKALGLEGDALFDWSTPLFSGEGDEERRMRLAACLLGDIARLDHPDVRANQAFARALFIPAVGIDHASRMFLALALFARYKGDIQSPITRPVRTLIGGRDRERAVLLGRALRLGHTVAGGAPDLLARTELELSRNTLTLRLLPGADHLEGEVVSKMLAPLAEILGRRAEIARRK
jgi:exopolyphosphatase/guanosine-5'-triphosphate,3'-diphosphate pyrophosphatase